MRALTAAFILGMAVAMAGVLALLAREMS